MENNIFKRGQHHHLNACLNFSLYNRSARYCNGYYIAAQQLIKDLNINNSGIDLIVYPIIYLYRQYIELALKIAIKKSRQKQKPTHNLITLWNKVNGELNKLSRLDCNLKKHITLEKINLITEMITKIHNIDEKGTSFRYHEDNNEKNNLMDINHIDLYELFNNMERFKNIFDEIISTLDYFDKNNQLD